MILDRLIFTTDPTLTPAQLDALPNTGTQPPAPEIRTASGSATLDRLTVTFTRPLDTASVTASKFQLTGGVGVNAAEVDANDARIVRLTTAAQTEGAAYTLTVSGVSDTSGTPIKANSTINFTAWRRVSGWVTKEIFFGVTGATVDDLKNAANFQAGLPDRVEYVRGFSLDREPLADNYGARLSAYFQPTQTGDYEFFVANDDEAEVLLSSDASEANLTSLGLFPLSPRAFSDVPSATAAGLTSGQRRLLVGLLKQSTADVYLSVGARRAGESAIPPVLGGDRISTWVNPDLGKVSFTRQPAAATAAAGQRARFEVNVEGSGQPIYYQWQADGVDILNAIRPVYVTPVLANTDNGRKYRCKVSAAGVDSLSAEVILSVSGNAPSPQKPFIGVNFVGGGNSLPGPLLPQDVTGAVLQENWNNLEGFAFDAVALTDAAGAATPVTLSATFTETWYSGAITSGGADGVLMQGMVSAGTPSEPVTLSIANIPTGKYQLLVYSLGFNFTPAYEQDYALTAGSSHPTITGRAEIGLDWAANPAFRRMTSTNPDNRATGNYVQFDDVSPAADGSLTLAVTWAGTGGNTHQPAINAIQLVKVVEITVPPTLNPPTIQESNVVLTWTGGKAPFSVERRDTLDGQISVVATTSEHTATVPLASATGYFQVRGSD
ncbi:MAG TPA: hypothetical protein DCE44_14570 [Verrucomicrobiales bacterium]|nr:hypothetical protein [Verrucomicrobiales bacterium]